MPLKHSGGDGLGARDESSRGSAYLVPWSVSHRSCPAHGGPEVQGSVANQHNRKHVAAMGATCQSTADHCSLPEED